MAFQIKNFVSIVAGMINSMRGANSKVTDYNVGSVARTLLESPAAEIEELYLQMLNGLVESIPVAIYQAFDFSRRPASYATGTVTFSADPVPAQNIPIPAGTIVTVPNTDREYMTTTSATLLAGTTTVGAPIQAAVAGFAGNALVSTITRISYQIPGLTAVANDTAITNGRDEETDEERKTRFGAYISTLSRGTLAAVEYAAGQAVVRNAQGGVIEYVDRAGLVEEVPGRVSCYIYNGSGATSDALVAAAQQTLDGYTDAASGIKVAGYRAGGVQVLVRKMVEQAVGLTATVTPDSGYTLSDLMIPAQTAFTDYLAEIPPGGAMYRSELTARIMAVEGMRDLSLTQPAANIAVAQNTVLVPGSVTLT